MTVAQLIEDLAAIKTTDSGKVEWSDNSLETVMDDVETLILERGLMQVASVSAMQDVSGEEANSILIDGVGLFLYASSGTPNGSTIYAASGGGVWKKQTIAATGVTELSELDDVTLSSPTDGQVLVYDDATEEWINGGIGWSAVSSKPRVVQEIDYTDAVLSLENMGYSDSLPSATANLYGNIVLGDEFAELAEGTYGIVVSPRGISDLDDATNSVIITPNNTIHAGVNGSVLRSTIIGQIGSIEDLYSSNEVQGIVAIGAGGTTWLVKDTSGQFYYNFDYSLQGLADHAFSGSVYMDETLRVDGDLDFNGIADFAGQVTINGVLYAPNINVSDWTDFTSAERGAGWLFYGSASTILKYRIDPMGKVSISGALHDSTGAPAAVAITFADGDLAPARDETFTIPRTNVGLTATYTPATAIVKTAGTITILVDSFTVDYIYWFSGISYYVD